QFRNKYRNVDVLMVDDVQFIAGKNTTQEEFFNTFNTLHTSGKQIIISSDKPPKEIPALEDRLRSRFEGGLITDIQSPDYETRIAILQKKAAQESIVVDEKVLALIASKVNANIRQLEGAFTRVVAFSRLTNTPVDVKMAEAALKDIVDSQERKITIELIQQVVAEFYNITVESLVSSRRTADITYPRQIAMYLGREMTDLSLKAIGQAFNRDYSTVISACNKIEDDLRFDTKLPLVFKDLKKRIKGVQ
ncbi:MAG: chromosomal replication initiator protein DnaA, partial [Clostridia bacterium]|nr:chromosomal replication initiator protein DnaA [Clostridia bacterium]